MSTTTPLDPQPYLGHFGLTTFRPGQREAIDAVLAGQNCLCIMPTGGGKSLCYQLPAVARGGLTLVISPLIALMKDQVDAMTAIQVKATFINSSLAPAEQRLRLANMAAGQYSLVYVAPERLRNSQFLEALRTANVQLLAVDEAHCISEWGHDFRPDYARLGRFRQRLRFPQTIALTATATPEVRQDVVDLLLLREPQVFVSGFARPNLRFEVQAPNGSSDKDDLLLDFLRENPGSGIVYVSTRKNCAAVMTLIASELKRSVGLYHAGLLPEERTKVQEDFMQDRLQIIVATNAFGMGIDKRDLRYVIHYNMPGSLEAYYQEAGRAGRDGLPSRCLLLFSYQDRFIQEFFIDNAYPSEEIVETVYEYLREIQEDPIEVTLEELREELDLPIGVEGVGACERLLEKCGALERLDSRENKASLRIDSDLPTLVDLLPKEAKSQRKVLRQLEQEVGELRGERVYFYPEKIAAAAELDRDAVLRALRELNKLQCFDYVPAFRGRAIHMLNREREFAELEIDFDELKRRRAAEYAKLDRVIQFAQTNRCRQLEILDYFGDPARQTCGVCDNCVAAGKSQRKPPAGGRESVRPQPAAAASAPGQELTEAAVAPRAGAGDDAVLDAVRMVLSGVARTKGRFGKNVVAQMLRGSKSAEMAKFRLSQLSTFGLLDQLKHDEVLQLIDKLLAYGLLGQEELERHRPLLKLTELGGEVMRGTRRLDHDLSLPLILVAKLKSKAEAAARRNKKTAGGTAAAPAASSPSSSARSGGTFPRPDIHAGLESVLQHMASSPLADEDLVIDGWTEDEFSQSEIPLEPPLPPRGSTTDEHRHPVLPDTARPVESALPFQDRETKPSFYWTWRLLSSGFSVPECLQIRRLDAEQILDDVLRAADENLPVQAEWFLTPSQMQLLERQLGHTTPTHLRTVIAQLPPDINRLHIQLFLRCRAARATD